MNDSHFDRARNSIRIAIARLSQSQSYRPTTRNNSARAALQTQRDILKANLKKLDGGVIRIAAFGLVSRGKSAVLNALLGQNLLETGPINGVTKWPRSV
ncbi:dynamin family protein, partial [Zarconia navalis]|uniref:dynamin family protein n=1 Tax=Zarconia navalis TaxID=2992134 RepID=UPI0021F8C969